MKNKIEKYYDYIYFFIVILSIGFTIIYGQIIVANIGEFKQFMVFGCALPLWAIILIPVLITLMFGYSIYIAYKNGLIDFSRKSIYFIATLLVILIYMIFLISLKDNSHLYGDKIGNRITPTTNERIFSCLSFYLGILNIYAFYSLLKRTEHYKKSLQILLITIIGYALITIIYSLICEFDLYVAFFKTFDLVDKTSNTQIKSFYKIGNVYGHTLYIGLIATAFLGVMLKKPYISILSVLFVPFIFASYSRAGIFGSVIFYFAFAFYLIYLLYKKNKIAGYVVFGIYLSIILFVIIDTFFTHLIIIHTDKKAYNLYEFWLRLYQQLDNERLSLLRMIYKNANFVDYFYGLGFGLQFIPPRSYGYIYFMHNTFVEYLATGGVIYCLFIFGLFLDVIYKLMHLPKKYIGVTAVWVSLGLSQIFYGLFESIPAFAPDFFGAVMAFFFVVIPNEAYQESKGIMYSINSLDFKPLEYNLEFSIYKDKTNENFESIKESILLEMKKEYLVKKNVVLVNREDEEMFIKEVASLNENIDRTYKSYFDKENDVYYLLESKLNNQKVN